MAITKPYFRIIRLGKDASNTNYVYHKKYADDRHNLVHSYKIIENDLKNIFEYIHPSNNNKRVFSHRLYELFLRCATEFETNCKRILVSNGYTKNGKFDITDYYKLEKAMRLSQYKAKLQIWYPKFKIVKPFKDWDKGKTLKWYQDYNRVKHDRSAVFNLASLDNVLLASSGLLVVLFAQFGHEVFGGYNDLDGYSIDDDGFYYIEQSIFGVKPFDRWGQTEQYIFNTDEIIKLSEPFQQYKF